MIIYETGREDTDNFTLIRPETYEWIRKDCRTAHTVRQTHFLMQCRIFTDTPAHSSARPAMKYHWVNAISVP